MRQCCFCAYTSTSARGVRAHIAKKHSGAAPPRTMGKAKGPICDLCGWSHNDTDETPREGWALRRKRFARGKITAVSGTVTPNSGFLTLGEMRVPKGAKRIKRITVSYQVCQGPFTGPIDEGGRRYCVSCRMLHLAPQPNRKTGDA